MAMNKDDLPKEQIGILIDCVGIVMQAQQDPRNTIKMASQPLPVAEVLNKWMEERSEKEDPANGNDNRT